MVLKDNSVFGRSSVSNPVVPPPKPPQQQPVTGGVGTHTAYETDPYGRRVEVTYDATGKVIGSKNVNRNPDGSYVPTNGTSQSGGVPMNASNWQKLIALLKDKFGISL